MERPDVDAVRAYLLDLQDRLCQDLEAEDGDARFREEVLIGERGGLARPRVLDDGSVLESAVVDFAHVVGERLPPAATLERPELIGASYEATSVCVVVHPRNPHAPTSHANLHLFVASQPGGAARWWFGGGFDLTPYYGFEEDAVHWHRIARAACLPFGIGVYERFKRACDEHFVLPHRGEPRGIGGLYFDDHAEGGFERAFELLRSVGNHYPRAYLPILQRRKNRPWGERERAFQLYRRGRCVEFGLLYDRGTQRRLEAGGRVESILATLPPLAAWRYDWRPEEGTPEHRLYAEFLRPRDWLGELERG